MQHRRPILVSRCPLIPITRTSHSVFVVCGTSRENSFCSRLRRAVRFVGNGGGGSHSPTANLLCPNCGLSHYPGSPATSSSALFTMTAQLPPRQSSTLDLGRSGYPGKRPTYKIDRGDLMVQFSQNHNVCFSALQLAPHFNPPALSLPPTNKCVDEGTQPWPGTFKLSEVLPDSVYVLGCGEEGDTSPSELVAAWVVLLVRTKTYCLASAAVEEAFNFFRNLTHA